MNLLQERTPKIWCNCTSSTDNLQYTPRKPFSLRATSEWLSHLNYQCNNFFPARALYARCSIPLSARASACCGSISATPRRALAWHAPSECRISPQTGGSSSSATPLRRRCIKHLHVCVDVGHVDIAVAVKVSRFAHPVVPRHTGAGQANIDQQFPVGLIDKSAAVEIAT